MKTEKNILIAFLLNLLFSIFEFIGGIFTNSISIISDSVHDFADSISIGISYILEKISKKKPDETYTYGYLRYSVLGALLTTTILIVSSTLIIYNCIKRIITPVEINHSGMILFAIVGVIVNLIATLITQHGHSLNQKSVNLHMLEDVIGWIIVLIGAFIIKFTNITIIDPIMSILVSLFILINAIGNLKSIINIFLEKTPILISISEIKKQLVEIEGIIDVHHIHVWSMDGYSNFATMHVVVDKEIDDIKEIIKNKLLENNIHHSTIEIENKNDICNNKKCNNISIKRSNHNH